MISTISELASKYPNANTVIYGDFNDLNTNPITEMTNLSQIVWFPTRQNNTLDLVFTDIPELVNSPKRTCLSAPNVGNSDHSSITLSSQVKPKPKYVTVRKGIITEKAKIAITESLYHQSWEQVTEEPDPDRKAIRFQDIMTSVIDQHCPVKSTRAPLDKAPITTPLITKLRRAKNKAYKRSCPSWKYFGGHLKVEIHKFQQKQADNNINNVTAGSKRWWNNVRSVTGETKASNYVNYVNLDDRWLDPQAFCSQLNEYYLSIAGDITIEFPEIPAMENPAITVDELDVYKILKKINTNKATHTDDYPSWVTKNNADLLSEPITNIITSILNTGRFPIIWKRAQINPLPKTTNPKTSKDYRPISLLYHLSKIVELFIKKELSKFTPSDPHQYAYTQGTGTTDALVQVMSTASKALDEKCMYGVQCLFIGFSKAFDLMKPDTLARKLLDMDVPVPLVRLVINFLSHRTQCVKFQDSQSGVKPSRIGVPQGTILGPALWNVYVSDLCRHDPVVKYADDTTIYDIVPKTSVVTTEKSGRNRQITIRNNAMQSAADNAVGWCDATNQKINAAKTQYMLLTLQLNTTVSPPITIKGEEITQTKSAKLLGVIIDEHLSFSTHTQSIIEKTRSAVHGLLTLKRHGVQPKSLGKFYQARIVPILTYAAPAWYCYIPQYCKEQLERHQSLCLRLIFPTISSYTERLETSKVPRLNDVLENLCTKYVAKVVSDSSHRLYHHVPPKQSIHRHSARLSDKPILKSRTALLSKSLFHAFA